jgi:ABC-2 type transport system ATP-binding protein
MVAPSGATEPAIDVHGLVKRFGARTVVDRVDIRVARGEICGFLGPNGSGKTTTIRMLCGLLQPDEGEGRCLGLDIRTQARQIKRRVGYMTQRFGLYDDLSIAENLDFVARAYGMAGRPALVRQTLDRLGLATRLSQVGIGPDKFEAIAAMFDGGPPISANPRKVTGPKDLLEILELAR